MKALKTKAQAIKPYIITVFSVLVAGLIKIYIARVFLIESPFLLFLSAVMISAWYGGKRQGFLATFLALLFTDLVIVTPGTLSTSDPQFILRFLMFFIDCTLITFLCSALKTSEESARKSLSEVYFKDLSLHLSETRFKRVFESNMMGLAMVRISGEIVDINDYVLNILGYDRNEIINDEFDWKALVPSEYMKEVSRAFAKIRAGHVVHPFQAEYIKKDGTRLNVLLGATPTDQSTAVIFILDITEHKKTEEALFHAYNRLEEMVTERTRELSKTNMELKHMVALSEIASEELKQSQSFLDSIIENIPNMIFIKDAKDLKFVRFNKAGENLLGYSRDELIGKSDFDFFPEPQALYFTEKDRAVINGKVPVDIPEEPISTKTGVRYLHTKKIPVFNANGEPEYLLGISEDITEKKLAEAQKVKLLQEKAAREQAEKSAKYLAFLSQASSALTKSLDIEQMIKTYSKVITKNLAEWSVISLKDDIFVSMNRDESLIKTHQDTLRQFFLNFHTNSTIKKKMQQGEAILVTPSQSHKHHLEDYVSNVSLKGALKSMGVHSAIVVPLISYGELIGSMNLLRTNQHKHYTNFDLSIAQDLAKRATFAIENARLFKKAQEASRAKSAFLANMSHEIRTPLGAMIGFSELLMDNHNLSRDQMEYISTIMKNGRQLLRIVDEILDLSKVESERIHIENIEFSLPKLIDEVTSLLNVRAKEKNLQLRLKSLSPLPEKIISDPTRLRQILLNVIGNAIKFTEKGYVEVDIEVEQHEENKSKHILKFNIIDSGIGISREHHKSLFQPFVQGDSSTTRRFGGTGLGLFLSKKLANLLGGDLQLDSSYQGKGSKFIITIEFSMPDKTFFKDLLNQGMKLSKSMNAKTKDSQIEGNILVVDDAVDNRTLVSLYATRMGLKVDLAENGAEGVKKALSNSYDVILMDIQMPGMDGFEAVHTLRENNYKGPIVALTAHAMKGDREKCLQNGFDDYLCKPLDRESLHKNLAKYTKTLH